MMIMPRMALSPEQRRRLAVLLASDGETPEQVSQWLQVSERSVWRWLRAFRRAGEGALATRPGQGRPPKLTDAQARRVIDRVRRRSACDFGFATDRWTAPRVAALVERHFGVRMNHRYLNDWLLRHGDITPQVPETRAVERDDAAIARWVAGCWPLVKKK